MTDPTETPRSTRRRTDTRDPRASRARALKILFQADVRGVRATQTLDRLAGDASARAILDDADPEALGEGRELLDPVDDIDGFTATLVTGVADHLGELDTLIGRYARRWQISRMPVVDRTVLRLATYELLYESTPPPVVIDEAVTLAKTLSTDDSGRYVNGVLESIRKEISARGPEATGA
jgi:transcription antitermination protein NusB